MNERMKTWLQSLHRTGQLCYALLCGLQHKGEIVAELAGRCLTAAVQLFQEQPAP